MFPLIAVVTSVFLSSCGGVPFPADDVKFIGLSEANKISQNYVEPSTKLKISKVEVESSISNHYARTKYIIKATNRAQFYQEGNYTIDFPDFQGVPEGLIMQAGFAYDAKIKMIEEAEQIYHEGMSNKRNVAILRKIKNKRNSYLLSFIIEPHSESSFHITFIQGHQKTTKGYEFTYRIDPKKTPSHFALEVSIRATLPLKYVKISPLHSEAPGFIEEISHINRNGLTTALIKLELNETRLDTFFDKKSYTVEKPNGFKVQYGVDEAEMTTARPDSKEILRRYNEITEILRTLSDGTASISDDAYKTLLDDITKFFYVTDISALVTTDARPIALKNAYPSLGFDRSALEYRFRSHCFPRHY